MFFFNFFSIVSFFTICDWYTHKVNTIRSLNRAQMNKIDWSAYTLIGSSFALNGIYWRNVFILTPFAAFQFDCLLNSLHAHKHTLRSIAHHICIETRAEFTFLIYSHLSHCRLRWFRMRFIELWHAQYINPLVMNIHNARTTSILPNELCNLSCSSVP